METKQQNDDQRQSDNVKPFSDITKPESQEYLPNLEELKRFETLDNMELITRKALGLHLNSLNIEFSQTALDELFELYCTHIHYLFNGLQRMTNTQRRSKAAPKDVKKLFKSYNIDLSDLEDELTQTQKRINDKISSQKEQLEQLATEIKKTPNIDSIETSDPSYAFFAQDTDIFELIPPTHKRAKAIPSWFPQYPPDHTYRHTAKFFDRVTDQKVVRTKIAEESRLGEKALDHLIFGLHEKKVDHKSDDKDNKGVSDEEEDDDVVVDHVSEVGDVVEKEGREQPSEYSKDDQYNIWTNGDKNFNIELYARARLAYLKKRDRKRQLKLDNVNNEYVKLVKFLSPYSKDDFEEPNSLSSHLYLKRQVDKVSTSLISLKKKKLARSEEREKLLEIAKENEKLSKLKESTFENNEDLEDFNNFENFENFENFANDDDVQFDEITEMANENTSNGLEFDGNASRTSLNGNESSIQNETNVDEEAAVEEVDFEEIEAEVDESKFEEIEVEETDIEETNNEETNNEETNLENDDEDDEIANVITQDHIENVDQNNGILEDNSQRGDTLDESQDTLQQETQTVEPNSDEDEDMDLFDSVPIV